MSSTKPIDIVGQRFGRWTVISNAEPIKRKDGKKQDTAVLCKCDCGTERIVKKKDLMYGSTRSCGCLARELARNRQLTHGMTETRIFRIWDNMNLRCKKNTHWNRNYAGKGITVCDEWRGKTGFSKFYEWAMKNGYTDELTIDRIDYSGDYTPENCRWVDMVVQGNNRCNNRRITYDGRTQTITQWSRETGVNMHTIRERLNRGWDVGKALGLEA